MVRHSRVGGNPGYLMLSRRINLDAGGRRQDELSP